MDFSASFHYYEDQRKPIMTHFKIVTSKTGEFIVTDQSITRSSNNITEVSKGMLVSRHFTSVQRALFTAYFLAEGKCYESLLARSMEPDESVPHLDAVLDTMTWHINSLTDGEYGRFTDSYDAHRTVTAYHLWHEMETIILLIRKLSAGTINEEANHLGSSQIEATGRKLVDSIMDLVWLLDNESSSQEDVDAALEKYGKIFS